MITHRVFFFAVAVLLAQAQSTLAESEADLARTKKSAKPVINIVKQEDGRIIQRLDMTALAGAGVEERVPDTPQAWLQRKNDPTRNGLLVRQPKLFSEWLNAVTEPRFMTAIATVALNPGALPLTLNRLADPATSHNWSELVDPEVFLRWVATGMDPRLYQAVFQHLFDPKKYLRWLVYSGYSRLEVLPAVEENQAGQAGRVRDGEGWNGGQDAWMRLPRYGPHANPWLENHYRY